MPRRAIRFTIAWIALALVSAAILLFGLVTWLLPAQGDLYPQALGLASFGLGLFGGLITIVPFRGGQRWAWFALWFYPLFWAAHLIGGLPPGQDHVHQVVLLVVSVVALVLGGRAVPVGGPHPPRSARHRPRSRRQPGPGAVA